MRIVLVTHFYPSHGGGVEKVAGQLALRMAAAGHDVRWFASDTDEPPAGPGVRCVPMRAFNGVERTTGFPYPLWGPGSLARLARAVREADAVHVHDCIYAGSLLAAAFARRHGKRLAVTQHIGLVPLLPLLRPVLGAANRLGARLVLERAAGVAFISPAVHRYFEAISGPSSAYHDVANGVDHEMFHPGDLSPQAQRAALGFDPARPLLLFVGRFVAKKRLWLVRAMAEASPDWQWCVIGHGPEQPQTWGLPNVRVLPPMAQPVLADYYRAADLLVLPSEGEGFPLVVQEAMACGLPACITADVAAGSTMPRSLWLELPEVPAETARHGAAVIANWLALPGAERTAKRAACAEHASKTWHWDVAARAHLCWLQADGA
ncbi:MAG: glycosyltransferase family 4 protein [Betaproteobacteria bacterium]|nr:glycosyltransferase family 4 protein [Betaproteobacteria bacterium]